VGHGVQYPGFSAGVVYNTPSIGGFTLTAGIYDPLTLPGLFDRTPLPRTEGELVYDLVGSGDDNIHLFVNGVWQRMVQEGRPTAPRTTLAADPWGVGYGVRGQAGFFKAGVASHYGRGIGLSYPLENTPTVAVNPGGNADVPGAYTLRMFDGYYAQMMMTFGNTDLAAGAGISRVKATEFDANANLLQSQRGLSLGLYQHVDKAVFAVEYFRGDYKWLMGDHQGMNFYNIGATVLW
jgi:hypothetical protein